MCNSDAAKMSLFPIFLVFSEAPELFCCAISNLQTYTKKQSIFLIIWKTTLYEYFFSYFCNPNNYNALRYE